MLEEGRTIITIETDYGKYSVDSIHDEASDLAETFGRLMIQMTYNPATVIKALNKAANDIQESLNVATKALNKERQSEFPEEFEEE